MPRPRRAFATLACVSGGVIVATLAASGEQLPAAVSFVIGCGLVGAWLGPSPRAADWIVLSSSLVLLGVIAVQWQIADALTVFGMFAVMLAAVVVQIAVLIVAIGVAIRRWRSDRWRALRPLTMWVAAAILWAVVPWTNLNLVVVWHARHARFDEVVALVRRGQLRGHGLTSLPSRYQSLSSNGAIWICGSGDSATVLFFTFSGILDHFSGFVHVDPDVPPSGGCFGADRPEVVKRAPNWYFLASH